MIMGKPTGFMEFERAERQYAPVEERTKTWTEFVVPLATTEVTKQAARCMDCGIPFCHNGCPVNNQIPDWNDLVYRDDWKRALDNLHSTNNFPEVTGRICPAPCEAACTLNIDDNPVAIKTIECAIVDRGFAEGWVVPVMPVAKTGRRVAIVGSGPAGLAAAQQLARAGHDVHVYEKSPQPGGLLRYGIPDFKMEKGIVERRITQMTAEGVTFHCDVHVGVTVTAGKLAETHDAVLLANGSEVPFDFFAKAPGRDLAGIHYAMDFLPQQNRRVAHERLPTGAAEISAKGCHVVVIGGGDTGSDCIGTSFRQGAASVTQLEIMPQPPVRENKAMSWPHWPMKLRVSSSQAEGATVEYAISTTSFSGEKGRVKTLHYTRVDAKMQPIAGTEGRLDADLVLFAMGFSSPGAASGASTATTATTACRGRPRCSWQATCGGVNPSSSGRSAKGGRRRTRSTRR
jgi:glutamate synthase (NADPH) small chain